MKRRKLVSEIDDLERTGGIHRVQWGFHRSLSQKFPYEIFYLVKDQVVLVRAVFDCRRDPKRLREWIAKRRIKE